MRAGAPPQLVIANLDWKYTITPGTYRSVPDGMRRTRIDAAITALTEPLASAVAPHGLLGVLTLFLECLTINPAWSSMTK